MVDKQLDRLNSYVASALAWREQLYKEWEDLGLTREQKLERLVGVGMLSRPEFERMKREGRFYSMPHDHPLPILDLD